MAKHGEDRGGDLVCSFCGKSQDEVRKLIAGPTVYICDECIDLCNDIIAEECDQEEGVPSTSAVPKPAEIKLDRNIQLKHIAESTGCDVSNYPGQPQRYRLNSRLFNNFRTTLSVRPPCS